MNCIQFYEGIARREYQNNPERAEELYNYSKELISEALQGEPIKDMPTDIFGGKIFKYWNQMGLSLEQCSSMLKFSSSEWRNKELRPEFDEEYVEYGFLSIEDGGRGVEY
jgi:hypothetical protein